MPYGQPSKNNSRKAILTGQPRGDFFGGEGVAVHTQTTIKPCRRPLRDTEGAFHLPKTLRNFHGEVHRVKNVFHLIQVPFFHALVIKIQDGDTDIGQQRQDCGSDNRRQNELRHFAQKWAFLRFMNFKWRKYSFPPPSPPCNVVPLF